jgi:hypothetical protein
MWWQVQYGLTEAAPPGRTGGNRAVIEGTVRSLREWAAAVAGDAEVTVGPPGVDGPRSINLYLLELGERPASRGTTSAPLQLALRYLVTARSDDPEDAHRMLVDLAFSAMDEADLELDLRAMSPELWLALDAPPQPAFIVSVAVRRRRTEPRSVPVRLPLRVTPGRMIPLEGRVVGPGGVPLADATVELPDQRVAIRTDGHGAFRFAAVPAAPARTRLRVRRRGREISLAVLPDPKKPIVIELDPREDADG